MIAISTQTSSSAVAQLRVSLDRIRVAENVRELDLAHVDALAASIELQGVIVPLVVRPATGDQAETFELVAGFHRFAAASKLKLADVPVVVRDLGTEDADRAVENITRKALDPREEARAVQAMLARGLTPDGAAQALGWSRQRVTARVKLLELPELAQQLVGERVIALSAVDPLLAIGRVSPELLDAVVAHLAADGNGWMGERLAREPGWVLDAALRQGTTGVFAAHLSSIRADAIAELRLGKKTDALYEQATALAKRLDRHAYGPPEIRYADEDVDQARAAGVLIEFERSRPVITDRTLYREFTKTAIKRTAADLQARVEAVAGEQLQARAERREQQAQDPLAAAARERDSALRELADQAHGANLDLGQSLLDGLSVVDPADLQVARFFVYALLGPDWDASPYTQTGERVHRLAANGIRLIVGELRQDVTQTRKGGTPGRLRIDYGDHAKPEPAVKWLWRYLDGAKSAGELYGRALVVIAAEHYATRLVVPASQRTPGLRWGSRKDTAAKALAKLAGPHLPASLKRLERAVTQAHSTYQQAEQAHRTSTRPPADAVDRDTVATDEPDVDAGGDVDEHAGELDPEAERERADDGDSPALAT